MQVIWADRARADLDSIRAYIGDHNPSAAKRVAAAIIRAGRSLRRFPLRGRPGFRDTRELVIGRFPYIIVYRVFDAPKPLVLIARVWHAAQDRSGS